MSIGNLGAVKNLMQGYIASEFAAAYTNQGVAMFPDLVEYVVAGRADLTEANLRVTRPFLFDGSTDVDVEAGAVKLIGLVVENQDTVAAAVEVYATNTVTEGTTVPAGGMYVAPIGKTVAWVLPTPISLAALSWSSLDGTTKANTEGGTLNAANKVRVMLVYAE